MKKLLIFSFLITFIRSSDAYADGRNYFRRVLADSARPVDRADWDRCCERIMLDIQRVFFLRDRNGRMKLQVRGVYAHGSALFFRLELNNRSPQDYELDSIRFLVTGTGKSSPAGARILTPLFVYGGTTLVPGYSRAASVVVLPHFTLPIGGQLLIRMRQTNGARPLQISTTRWTLARARLI